MQEIVLTRGYKAFVDDDDFARVSQYKWGVDVNRNGYVWVRRYVKKKAVPLSKFILNVWDKEVLVDHVSRDSLDNRKCNLRICTLQQNNQNRKYKNTASGFKGVCRSRKIWKAYGYLEGKYIYLGSFKNSIIAAKSYDSWAKDVLGKFAVYNFV